jgi:hypothetical protein
MISGNRPPVELRALSSVTNSLLQATPALGVGNNQNHWTDVPLSSTSAPMLGKGQLVQLDYKPGEQSLNEVVDEVETQIILDAMRRHRGHRNAVCKELGITRKGLYLKDCPALICQSLSSAANAIKRGERNFVKSSRVGNWQLG